MVGGERRRSERDYHKVLRLFFKPVDARQCAAWQPCENMNGIELGLFSYYLVEISCKKNK